MGPQKVNKKQCAGYEPPKSQQKTMFRICGQNAKLQTHLHKRRRTHRRAVVAVVVAVAVAAVVVAVVPCRRRHHRHGRHHCHHHRSHRHRYYHRRHRTLVCASEFVEVCPGYGPSKNSPTNDKQTPKSSSTLTLPTKTSSTLITKN